MTSGSPESVMTERKPLAHLERRDIQRTFRFTESEDKALQAAAVEDRVDFSTYVREALFTGHTMKQAQRMMKRASG